jgi:hypothetical protein
MDDGTSRSAYLAWKELDRHAQDSRQDACRERAGLWHIDGAPAVVKPIGLIPQPVRIANDCSVMFVNDGQTLATFDHFYSVTECTRRE